MTSRNYIYVILPVLAILPCLCYVDRGLIVSYQLFKSGVKNSMISLTPPEIIASTEHPNKYEYSATPDRVFSTQSYNIDFAHLILLRCLFRREY